MSGVLQTVPTSAELYRGGCRAEGDALLPCNGLVTALLHSLGPDGEASGAEVRRDGVIHPVHIVAFQLRMRRRRAAARPCRHLPACPAAMHQPPCRLDRPSRQASLCAGSACTEVALALCHAPMYSVLSQPHLASCPRCALIHI